MSFAKSVKHSLALLAIAFILSESTFKGRLSPSSRTAFAESSSTTQGTDGIQLPAPGKSITRELPAGEIHSYQITLDTNEYLHAFVDQQGIEAGVTLYEPAGRKLVEVDCRHYGPTPVSLISETPGIYRLEVHSLENEQTLGRYELRVEEIRPAMAKDKHRIAAEKVFAEGEQLLKEWKAESSRRAIDRFKDSLSSWRAAADRRGEALALKRIGDVSQPFGEFNNALTSYDQALSLSREIKDLQGESETLNEIGYVYLTLGKNQQALKLSNQALKLSQATGNQREIARAHHNLGEIQYGLGELQQSLKYFQEALQIWRGSYDRRGQALTLLNAGYTYSDLGQVREAFDSYKQALSLWQATRDHRGQAITFAAIGRLYSRMGESQEALDFFARARDLIQPIGDPIWEASVLNGMAYIYGGLGEKQRALECYDRALLLFRAANYPGGEATTLGEAGRVYFSLGDNLKALECHQHALSIFSRVDNSRMEIVELKEIGKVYDAQGDKNKALEYYRRARSFYRAEKVLRGEAVTLNLIGRVYEERGQRQKALDLYEEALPLNRKSEDRAGEAATLQNIARVERDSGHLTEARSRAEEALVVVESLRAKVNSQDLRTSYFESVRQQYLFYIDLLMRLHRERPGEGFDIAAFEASERARARSFLETLAIAQVGVRDKANPVLLARESKLSKELNDKAARRSNLEPVAGQAEASTLSKEIDELTWQLREVETQISAGAIQNQLSLPQQPLSLKAIQQILDDNTLLLEYSLGDDCSYLWAVTRTDVTSYQLPGRVEIEKAAREVHSSLIANQPLPQETFGQQQARVETANAQLPSQIANLSRILLERVTDKLGTKRLLIVPDGALQYVPFQILKTPGGPGPLVVDHEIVNEPSASTLALLVTETKTRKPPSRSVAVLADPVFEADDPRMGSANKPDATSMRAEAQETELHRAFRDVSRSGDGSHIPRLRASGVEADAIMSVTPWWSGFEAVGFEANRATAMRADLSEYRIVHFATHGLLNSEHPELSGIVLSLFDQQGQPQDGFLRLHDIYNLNLPVDLVVLSACNTGLGKDVKSEGLIGLTRGFMYAGASSVVASLWKVDDEATAELMRLFYGYMLRDGLSPAAALRKAQVIMSQQKRWQSPYYWAGFVIQGQYLPKAGTSRFPTHLLALSLFAAVGVSAAMFYALKRRRKITL